MNAAHPPSALVGAWRGAVLCGGSLSGRAVRGRSELRSECGFGLGVAIKSPPWSRSIRAWSPAVTEPLLERSVSDAY